MLSQTRFHGYQHGLFIEGPSATPKHSWWTATSNVLCPQREMHSSVRKTKSWHVIQHGWATRSIICGGNQYKRPHSVWFHEHEMPIPGTSTEQKILAAVSGWRNEKVSFGSDENVLDSEGCPALKIVRILSCVPQKSRFYISELFSNEDIYMKALSL